MQEVRRARQSTSGVVQPSLEHAAGFMEVWRRKIYLTFTVNVVKLGMIISFFPELLNPWVAAFPHH
jgi:hypothetical protein